jgi:hypothetical protein
MSALASANLGKSFPMVSNWYDRRAMIYYSRFLLIAKSPADVRQAVRNQRIAEDTKMDNMALWMRNVDSKCHFHYVLFMTVYRQTFRGSRRCSPKV